MSEWIDVNDRLPEPSEEPIECSGYSEYVLIYDGHIYLGRYYFPIREFVLDNERESVAYSVTHWMPLPTPPKGGPRGSHDIQSMSAWRDDEGK
jgi:hypothetical protein